MPSRIADARIGGHQSLANARVRQGWIQSPAPPQRLDEQQAALGIGRRVDGVHGGEEAVAPDEPGLVELVDVAARFGRRHASSGFSNGDTTFSAPESFQCPSGVTALAIGDLNEDCVPDLVAAMGVGQDLCVLMSDRD